MTVPVPPPPPPADPMVVLEALVRRYRQLGSEIAELQGEQADLKAKIVELVPVGWKSDIDGVTASYRPANRAFNPATALTLLPTEIKAGCIDRDPRFDPKLLREAAEAQGILEQCMEIDPARQPVLKLA